MVWIGWQEFIWEFTHKEIPDSQYTNMTQSWFIQKDIFPIFVKFNGTLMKLGDFPEKYPLATYNQQWIQKQYRDFVFENIHIAYKVVKLDTGEKVVYVADACHSLLHHN